MTLTQFLGDSITHLIPLRWQGAAFEPGSDWLLIFTVKVDTADADDGAVIQKASGLGISVAGALASVAMVPQDTVDVTTKTLLWDIQAQHATTGEVRTVASGNLRLIRDITRLTETSIPIHTTEPPYPSGGNLAADTHAAASKETPADADEIPLVDSAAAWGLKKLTWAALKAALKTHFDTLYQAAGLTWATLSGKPTSFDPSAHKASHATGGTDALTPSDIGAQPAGSYAPATGISPSAITGTAVITTDFRLSNPRTPTAHTHASADITDATNEPIANTLARRDSAGGCQFTDLSASVSFDAGTFSVDALTGSTFEAGSTVTFNATAYTYGTGAASAHRTALGAAATVHTHVSADITDATSAATPGTVVLRNAGGGAAFAGLNTNSGSYSQTGGANFNVAVTTAANLTATGAGTVTVSGAAGNTISGGMLTFSPSGFSYGAGKEVLHRTALGSGATGDLLFQAVTPAAARETLLVPASDPSGVAGADAITNIISLTQAEYDAIGTKSATTLYVVT